MKSWGALIVGLALALPAQAVDWSAVLKGLTNKQSEAPAGSGVNALSTTDINAALKETLSRGADAAVNQLGTKDGFFDNAALRIMLPQSLQTADKMMRTLGMSKQADELVLAMNRAAEAAVPEARTLLIDAVKRMTLEDAKGILTGGKTSATDFFRRKTEAQLIERFGPIVKATTDKVGLARQYNKYADVAVQFNLLDKNQANIEQYVARQAVDRLYIVIGEQEAAIRANPAQAGSELLRKVFGAVSGR